MLGFFVWYRSPKHPLHYAAISCYCKHRLKILVSLRKFRGECTPFICGKNLSWIYLKHTHQDSSVHCGSRLKNTILTRHVCTVPIPKRDNHQPAQFRLRDLFIWQEWCNGLAFTQVNEVEESVEHLQSASKHSELIS